MVVAFLCVGVGFGLERRFGGVPDRVLTFAAALSQEDNALRMAVSQFPYRKGSFAVDWKVVSKVSGRTTKQCRERWINVLDPTIRRDQWTSEEIRSLFEAQEELGNKWAAIAMRLPGR
jgi:hypothetical protein